VKALFLGAFAASQAAVITAHLETTPEIEILADEGDRERLAAALADAEIVLSGGWHAAYPPARRMRLLQLPLGGTDAVDIAALPPGVNVCNAYGHEAAIGEFAMMVMLAWRHRLFDIASSFRAGSWEWSPLMGGRLRSELAGQTVGIVGFGHIGREIAWRAHAFGCRVIAANRTPREPPSGVARIYPLDQLDRMLGECDIVVLACALTEETRGLVGRDRLTAMKRDAFLVNLARGPVCDEDALYEALRDRRIGGAALDTWWQYPTAEQPQMPPSRHPFAELPNVIMTPHCSPWTAGTVERRARDIARNIDRFVRGEPLANLVLQT
jgi:phosphoglycerate dehydrogenase-like enzyme